MAMVFRVNAVMLHSSRPQEGAIVNQMLRGTADNQPVAGQA